jgi:hypothetical protein
MYRKELIDVHETLDLHEEPVDQPEIAPVMLATAAIA